MTPSGADRTALRGAWVGAGRGLVSHFRWYNWEGTKPPAGLVRTGGPGLRWRRPAEVAWRHQRVQEAIQLGTSPSWRAWSRSASGPGCTSEPPGPAACTTWSTRSSTTRSTRHWPGTARHDPGPAPGGRRRVRVIDNGRGIPVTPIPGPQDRKPAVEVVLTTLHAGGKFDGKSYAVSGGLHGVGVSVVNALSSRLIVEVARDGHGWRQEFERGRPRCKLSRGRPPPDGDDRHVLAGPGRLRRHDRVQPGDGRRADAGAGIPRPRAWRSSWWTSARRRPGRRRSRRRGAWRTSCDSSYRGRKPCSAGDPLHRSRASAAEVDVAHAMELGLRGIPAHFC